LPETSIVPEPIVSESPGCGAPAGDQSFGLDASLPAPPFHVRATKAQSSFILPVWSDNRMTLSAAFFAEPAAT
jgi:hypothetical protein